MKERPINFFPPEVRPTLEGRKMQARRAVKPQPQLIFGQGVAIERNGSGIRTDAFHIHCRIADEQGTYVYCPYGKPGDRLWVRERLALRPDRTPKMIREGADTWPKCVYLADGAWYGSKVDLATTTPKDYDQTAEAIMWKGAGFKSAPSIHMPRWASRITLEVTGVRVERLQEIGEEDAEAEGIEFQDDKKDICRGWLSADRTVLFDTARLAYENLWHSINAKRAPWASNPLVWVIEFKRVVP